MAQLEPGLRLMTYLGRVTTERRFTITGGLEYGSTLICQASGKNGLDQLPDTYDIFWQRRQRTRIQGPLPLYDGIDLTVISRAF